MKHLSFSLIAGCVSMLTGCTSEPALAQPQSRPRIDVEAPANVETATFALG